MSLTAFQRYRRMQQVEEMKPENILREQSELNKEEKSIEEESDKDTSTNIRRRRRN